MAEVHKCDSDNDGGDITPGLPATDNFRHWPPWRPLVVETARRVLDYTGGTLVIPMTVAEVRRRCYGRRATKTSSLPGRSGASRTASTV